MRAPGVTDVLGGKDRAEAGVVRTPFAGAVVGAESASEDMPEPAARAFAVAGDVADLVTDGPRPAGFDGVPDQEAGGAVREAAPEAMDIVIPLWRIVLQMVD